MPRHRAGSDAFASACRLGYSPNPRRSTSAACMFGPTRSILSLILPRPCAFA